MVLLEQAREEDHVDAAGQVLELRVGHDLALLGDHAARLPHQAADPHLWPWSALVISTAWVSVSWASSPAIRFSGWSLR